MRPRWPYDMRPSARAVKYVCHCNSLGGATWRSITAWTDRQTDKQTDRVRRNMQPPPREEGRIIIWKHFKKIITSETERQNVLLFEPVDICTSYRVCQNNVKDMSTYDQLFSGSTSSRHALGCKHGQVVHIRVPLLPKWYNLVPTYGQRCSAARKVTWFVTSGLSNYICYPSS